MEMLLIGGLILVVIGLSGFYGWQAGKSAHDGRVPQIEPPPEGGLPPRAPNLTGSEPCCR